jgi:hypothetical protein
MNVNQFIKISKDEFDRLVETSPEIPDDIISDFSIFFKGNFEYDEIVKPELCGQLVSTERSRNQWSTSENIAKKNNLKQQRDNKMKQYVLIFIDSFSKINGREPMESEIVDNLKDQLDPDKIKHILFKIKNEPLSIIKKKVVDAFIKFPEHARFYGSTIKWLGFKRADIEARHGQRFSGKPGYTIKKRLSLAADIIISFSGRPLRFAIVIGLLMSIVSLLLSIWVLVGAFSWGFDVLGWPSFMSCILFTGGAILVVLGIIGIYLGRVFQEVKSRPLYVVSETRNVEIVK